MWVDDPSGKRNAEHAYAVGAVIDPVPDVVAEITVKLRGPKERVAEMVDAVQDVLLGSPALLVDLQTSVTG